MRKIRNPKPETAANAQDETVCAGHALGFPLRSELGFMAIENVTLDIFRCVCDVYATASAQPWEVAVRLSEEQLGAIDGPLLVARVTALLRALRQERAIGFSYLSVGCQHVSPDELTIAGLLKSVRTGDELAFQRGIALVLHNGQATERTRLAVRCLADAQLQHMAPQSDEPGASEFEHQTVQALYLH
jgi:hypothetical protein